MSKFKMEVDLGNAAFHDDGRLDPGYELSRIICDASDAVGEGYWTGRCIDANGNHVGDWRIEQ